MRALAAERERSGSRRHSRSLRGAAPDESREAGCEAADTLLHTRILAASGNQFYQQMAAIIRGALTLVGPIPSQREDGWTNAVNAHGSVVDAVDASPCVRPRLHRCLRLRLQRWSPTCSVWPSCLSMRASACCGARSAASRPASWWSPPAVARRFTP
ncbi:FCD domain-containing protein [Paraburkholderia sp. A1RI_3L]|uniref:FCD domain-containing protein n=1 Tax=Paraburkholderia sp. A1RI_3L TaxID=3029269 RepID=UPI003BA171AC